jgi:hypothetical protein
VTYVGQSGVPEQPSVRTPWHFEFKAQSGAVLALSAQKFYKEGKVLVEIYVNDELLKQAEVDSPYGIVSVDGTVP